MRTEVTEKSTHCDGVTDHYLGKSGREYFAWQGADGIACALMNKHIWAPYIRPDDDLLEFGCGGGFLLKILEAKRKIGVEINPCAREQAEKQGIEVYQSLEGCTGQFDRVISSHVLEHTSHPREMVLMLKAKLRDVNSRMLLLLPLDDWRSRSNRVYRSSDVNMHLYTWTPQLLGNLLSCSGLDVKLVQVINHARPPIRRLKLLLWQISPVLFHLTAYWWSVANRQRQLFAVAGLKSSNAVGKDGSSLE